jgi:hypothetical protein
MDLVQQAKVAGDFEFPFFKDDQFN